MKETMRIGMLSSDFLPNIGGIASHIAGLSKAMIDLGHDVRVIQPHVTSRLWEGVTETRANDIPVTRIAVPRIPGLTGRIYVPRVAGVLRRLCRLERLDLIHVHTLFLDPLAAARCEGVARVFTNHSSQFLEMARTPEGSRKTADWLQCFAQIIAPSEELATETKSIGIDAARVHVIANGVDTARFRPDLDRTLVRRRYGIDPAAFVFLCARRLETKNGVRYWVRALPEIARRAKRPIHFLFAGDFPPGPNSDHDEVVSLLRSYPADIPRTFAGNVANEEMPLFMVAADATVLPSLMEATSIAGLEAMASGLPILGTRVGGIPEIVQDGVTGLLVEAGSVDALVHGALAFCDDTERTAHMGSAARATCLRTFSWTTIAKRTLAVYQAAMGRP